MTATDSRAQPGSFKAPGTPCHHVDGTHPGGPLGKPLALLELSRPGNVLMAGIGVVLGAWVVGLDAPTLELALAAIATMLVVAGGNTFNDITDVAIDRAAHPGRPLPSGRVTVRAAGAYAVSTFLGALALAALVSFPLLLLVLTAEAMLTAYEVHLKASGLLGNLVVAALVGATFLAGGLAADRVTPTLGILAGLAFLSTVGREVWKDAEDEHADARRRTLARVRGPELANRIAGALTLGAVALSPLPWLLTGFGGPPYLAVVAFADVLFVLAVVAPDPASAQRRAKWAMLVALVGFGVGAVAGP